MQIKTAVSYETAVFYIIFTGKGAEDMADSKSGYAGQVQHAGAQKVNAPYSSGGKKGQSTVKTGGDLRTGKGGR